MSFFFRSRTAVPPAMTLEGVMGPNSRLDEAAALSVENPEALVVGANGELLFSSGKYVRALASWTSAPRPWGEFDHTVTALARSPGGLVLVCLLDGTIRVHDQTGRALDWNARLGGYATDALFLSEEEIAILFHGYAPDQEVLSIAPWDETSRGSLISLDRSGATKVLAGGLHCPMGLSLDGDGSVIVTELETARILGMSGRVLRSGFPGYIGRIRKTAEGYLLSCLSRRDPLIEFLKTETEFVVEMKKTIDPRHWIAPRAHSEFSHDLPIELGATRLFGEVKPWAPSFSYGLLITLDKDLMPTGSYQSRANGRRHAICDALTWNGDIVAVSKASGEILNLGPGAPTA